LYSPAHLWFFHPNLFEAAMDPQLNTMNDQPSSKRSRTAFEGTTPITTEFVNYQRPFSALTELERLESHIHSMKNQLETTTSSMEETRQKVNFHIDEAMAAFKVLSQLEQQNEQMNKEAELLSHEIQTKISSFQEKAPPAPLADNSIQNEEKQEPLEKMHVSQTAQPVTDRTQEPQHTEVMVTPSPLQANQCETPAESAPILSADRKPTVRTPEPSWIAKNGGQVKAEPNDSMHAHCIAAKKEPECDEKSYALAELVPSGSAQVPSLNMRSPEAWLVHRASTKLVVAVEGGADFAGEYRLHQEKVHGRPAYKHAGKEPVFLFWLRHELAGGHWAFSSQFGSADGLLARSLQAAWTALPDELCSESWTLGNSERVSENASCLKATRIAILRF